MAFLAAAAPIIAQLAPVAATVAATVATTVQAEKAAGEASKRERLGRQRQSEELRKQTQRAGLRTAGRPGTILTGPQGAAGGGSTAIGRATLLGG